MDKEVKSKDLKNQFIGLTITLIFTTSILSLNLFEISDQQKTTISIILTIIITAIGIIWISYKKLKEIDQELEKNKVEINKFKENFKISERLSNIESIIFHKEKIKKWQ